MGLLGILAEVGLSEKQIAKALTESTEVKAGVIAKAQEVRDYWKSIAPVSSRPAHALFKDSAEWDHPGDYRKSLNVTYHKNAEGEFYAKVGTKDPKCVWLEYGTAKMPELAFAQKTCDHFNGHSGKVRA